MRQGVIDGKGNVVPLPKEIEAGVKNVSNRDGWNKSAADPYALPTETWREHVARRQRCLEIREKLGKGEVNEVNDLITLNLDLWQFARDAIVNCEGPELLRAFWHAIEKVTVLDPTCGSGAFLFSALRILETLYSDCLERMGRFVEDLAGKKHHPEQFNDFTRVLNQIAKHPNERHFILKSVIINNLFGVDIMEEAVEICKLRLFLTLVAQVERVEQIEPLPDIDFNIRTGNTLVGYTTAEQVRQAFHEEKAGEGVQHKLLFKSAAEDYLHFKDDVAWVERAFSQFRAQQTTHGGRVTHRDKQELRCRLEKLTAQLDDFLAGEYGVNLEKPKELEAWKTSHQPFHWFAEFYGIMRSGGFDVIIGNPPYVEYAKIKGSYQPRELSTVASGNLYGMVSEVAQKILGPCSRIGMIIPMSIVSTPRMKTVRDLIIRASQVVFLSHYSGNRNPSVLFEGVEMRLTICLAQSHKTEMGESANAELYSTHFRRWASAARGTLFDTTHYTQVPNRYHASEHFPKLGCSMEQLILAKLTSVSRGICVRNALISTGAHNVYAHRIASYYVKALTFIPRFSNQRDGMKRSDDYKVFSFERKHHASAACCVINSSLFYLYYMVFSDAYHCGRELIEQFPADISSIASGMSREISGLEAKLMSDLKKNSDVRKIQYQNTGLVEMQKFFPKISKPILNEIDCLLAKHYGFTDEELDFIINYDIKYRMGQESNEDHEE